MSRSASIFGLLCAGAATAQVASIKVFNAQPPAVVPGYGLEVLGGVGGEALVSFARPGSGAVLARVNPLMSGLTVVSAGIDLYPQKSHAFGARAILENNASTAPPYVVTDGTLAGTVPLPFADTGTVLTVLGSLAIYSSRAGLDFRAWDGATSTLLRSRAAGYSFSFVVAGAQAWFPDLGELWRTDGTPGGTVKSTDFCVSASTVMPTLHLSVGAKLVFSCTPGLGSGQTGLLRVTDGATTTTLASISPVSNGNFVTAATPLSGDRVLLGVRSDSGVFSYYVTDGTLANTTLLSVPANWAIAGTVNGKALLLERNSSGFVVGLHVTDGATITLVKALTVVTGNGRDFVFGPSGAVFLATDPAASTVTGAEPWFTDGTPGNTTLLVDAAPGAAGSADLSGTAAGASLVFSVNRTSVYVTDGTQGATALFSTLPVSSASASPHSALSTGARTFFGADDGVTGTELWVSDGTLAGTTQVADLDPRPSPDGSGYPSPPGRASGALPDRSGMAFWGITQTTGYEPFVTTGGAPVLLADLAPGAADSSRRSRFLTAGAALFFIAKTSDAGDALLRSDGTPAGTHVAVARMPGSSFDSIEALGGDVLWWDSSTNSFRRYVSLDGGVVEVKSLGGSGGAIKLRVVNDRAYFPEAVTPASNLYVSDGTPAGTRLLTSIAPARFEFNFPWAPLAGGFVEVVTAADAGRELWSFDGTAAGVTSLQALAQGLEFTQVEQLTPVQGGVYFTAVDAAHGRELWFTDGTRLGTHLVKDIAPGPWSAMDDTSAIVAFGTSVYFTASDGVSGLELWRSDGTLAGTVLVQDLNPGFVGSDPRAMSVAGCRLVFFGMDATRHDTLWSTAPVAAAPVTVSHTVTGTPASNGWYRGDVTVRFQVTSSGPTSLCSDTVITAQTAGTPVTCSATSACGGAPVTDIVLIKRDDVPPALTCPSSPLVVQASAPDAGFVDAGIVVSDATSAVVVTSSPDLTRALPLGDFQSTVTAVDEAGNVSTCQLRVVVRDTIAPQVTCLAEVRLPPTSPAGALVPDLGIGATDAVDPAPAISVTVDAGQVFPIGDTTVVATATDASGNAATCQIRVIVNDSAPPTLTCPKSVRVPATSTAGARVADLGIVFSDLVDPSPSLAVTVDAEKVFPIGDTTVVATATDFSKNLAQCEFVVTVDEYTVSRYRFGCTSGAGGPLWLAAALGLLLRRRRTSP